MKPAMLFLPESSIIGAFSTVSGGMLAGSHQTEFMAQSVSRTEVAPETSVFLEETWKISTPLPRNRYNV